MLSKHTDVSTTNTCSPDGLLQGDHHTNSPDLTSISFYEKVRTKYFGHQNVKMELEFRVESSRQGATELLHQDFGSDEVRDALTPVYKQPKNQTHKTQKAAFKVLREERGREGK